MPMSKLYERLGIGGGTAIQFTTAATAASSPAIDMSNVDRALVILSVGAITGTLSIALQAATSTVASDFAAFSTPVQATGITGPNMYQQLELLAGSMPAGKRYLRALVTATTISSTNVAPVGLIVLTEGGVQPAANASGTQTVVSA